MAHDKLNLIVSWWALFLLQPILGGTVTILFSPRHIPDINEHLYVDGDICDYDYDGDFDFDEAPGIARSMPGTPVLPSACKLNGP